MAIGTAVAQTAFTFEVTNSKPRTPYSEQILVSTLFVSKLPVPDSSLVQITLTTCKTTSKEKTFLPSLQLVFPLEVVAPSPA